jgi:hypothetical protein
MLNSVTGALSITAIGSRISFSLVFTVAILMISAVYHDWVWEWMNGDEEEDTVRFRQRLVFVLFWSVVMGLVQLRSLSKVSL